MHRLQGGTRRGALISPGLVLCLMLAGPADAATELRSGPSRVLLLELFTSQGCSSCPPADRWMSRLIDRPGLWVDYVPLAFHVDYWDDIGWVDPLAIPAYSARQRQYAQAGGIDIVYTPGFVLNGSEWRPWRTAREPTAQQASAGFLLARIDDGIAAVDYAPAARGAGELLANVAILGFGLTTTVLAGENQGRTLSNDFVVLGLEQLPMTSAADRYHARLPVPASRVTATRHAVVVWVSMPGSQLPLQAAGGWIAESP